jgi:predicted RNA-binding protein with PIN domain
MTAGYLFVDGYHVINAWPELQELGNLECAICIICQSVL